MDPSSATTSLGASESEDAATELEGLATNSDSGEAALKPIWMRHPGWLLFGLGFLIYMVIVPTVAIVVDSFTPVVSGEVQEMTVLESIRLRTVSCVVTFCFVGIGASIGSFLNVVIFRLPRRRPLLWPPSACANCRTLLESKYNIPILAWMKLGGRCRYCDVAISARYPLIEAVVGLVFAIFFFRELLSGGVNLPVRSANFYNGIVWILLYTKWDLVGIYFFHMVLLVVLLAWGMINYDRFRVPWMSVVASLAVFIGLASSFPHLNPTYRSLTDAITFVPQSLSSSLIGCVGGLVIGIAFSQIALFRLPRIFGLPSPDTSSLENATRESPSARVDSPRAELQPVEIDTSDESESSESVEVLEDADADGKLADLYGSVATEPGSSVDLAASLALVGTAMGVQAVVVVALLTAGLTLLAKLGRVVLPGTRAEGRTWPSTIYVFASSVALLFFWDPIHDGISRMLG